MEHSYIFTNLGPSFTNQPTPIEFIVPITNFTKKSEIGKFQPDDIKCENGSKTSSNPFCPKGCLKFICKVPAKWKKDDRKIIYVQQWFDTTAVKKDNRTGEIFEVGSEAMIAEKGILAIVDDLRVLV